MLVAVTTETVGSCFGLMHLQGFTMRSIKFLTACVIAAGLCGAQPTAFAALTYLVTVDTSSISGQSGWMEMQFNPGGLPVVTGSAVVSNFSTNATLNPASIEL